MSTVDALSVLIIEDDEIVSKTLVKLTQKRPNTAITAVMNGKEAIQSIKSVVYDLIFLDLGLPDMNGVEILKTALTDPASQSTKAMVVVMTGMPSVETAVECMKQGAFNFLAKPVDMKKVNEILELAGGRHCSLTGEVQALHVEIETLQRTIAEKEEEIKRLQVELKKKQK
jgi:DNA-binding NtrC family response regulator